MVKETDAISEGASPSLQAPAPKAGVQASLIVRLQIPAPIRGQLVEFFPSGSRDLIPVIFDRNSNYKPLQLQSTANKRKAAAIHDSGDGDAFATTARKRRRLTQPASQVKATKAESLKVEPGDTRPKPRGSPEVWADMRQPLCESLAYYHSMQAGPYMWHGYCYGFLVDNDNDERGYMDEKIVITRSAGGFKANESGQMEQADSQSSGSSLYRALLNNRRDRVPIMLIVGSKNQHCPTRVPHRFCVLGPAHLTDVWAEKAKRNNVIYRFRFELIDLRRPSWWGVKGSSEPPDIPDYAAKASSMTCSTCGVSSKQVDTAGWVCLSEACQDFFILNGEVMTVRSINKALINERTEWPINIKPPFAIKTPIPTNQLVDPMMETSASTWKGMICPNCGKCNSRTNLDIWECSNEACDFSMNIAHTVFPAAALTPDHNFEAEGHAICFDTYDEDVIARTTEFVGYYRKETYQLSPGNSITHYIANKIINEQNGGPDDLLKALQGEKMGMRRLLMQNSPVEGEMITKHFAINYGYPYKYIAAVDSKGFSEAPPVILDTLNRLTWAGQDAVRDGSFEPFNEILCVAYHEKMGMGWHDDGEKDLRPDVAAISLGGAADMLFRMKAKVFLATANGFTPENYNPEQSFQPGVQGWKLRSIANEHFKAGRSEEHEAAKAELFSFLKSKREASRKHAPDILKLFLRHGDIVVMHGAQVQRLYEHTARPEGKLRYALTARQIIVPNIPEDERWKGEFEIPADQRYDGDIGVFRSRFPEEESQSRG